MSEAPVYPPLFYAKDADETRRLLEKGEDPDEACHMGRTPLCFARS